MTAPATVEVETLDQFDQLVARSRSLRGVVVQSVDLSTRDEVLRQVDPHGALFLGCVVDAHLEEELRRRGALVFPRLPDVPFDPYQPRLYTADDLYDAIASGGDYQQCTDARIHAWNLAQDRPPSLAATLATSLHDQAISDALDDWWDGQDPNTAIGIMGGHAALRGSDDYRTAAGLAGALTRGGRLVLTGGGPGAMEAANLGAWLAHTPEALDQAIAVLATAADFHDDITAWAKAAHEVRRRWPATAESVGIPTWFYGHEPPNGFATRIAKYFSNALREDTLLQRCRGGIVYLPGAAGTVQEIFQAATGNYYAAPGDPTAPMVLVGVQHWTRTLPAWPLLQALGRGRGMGTRLHLVDGIDQAAEVLLG